MWYKQLNLHRSPGAFQTDIMVLASLAYLHNCFEFLLQTWWDRLSLSNVFMRVQRYLFGSACSGSHIIITL